MLWLSVPEHVGALEHPRKRLERIPADDFSTDARPKLRSIEEFLACVHNKSPKTEAAISHIVERFRQIDSAYNGRFVLGLQAATATLYWRLSTGAPRRIFAMAENGRFRVWLHYVLSVGREDVATIIRELSKQIIVIAPGETSGALFLDENNVDAILSMIDAVVSAVAQMEPGLSV